MLKIMNKIKTVFDNLNPIRTVFGNLYSVACGTAIATDKGFHMPAKGEYRGIKVALLKWNRTEYGDVDATTFVWFSKHGKDWFCRTCGDAYVAGFVFENRTYLLLGNPGTEGEKKILDSLLTERPTD